MNKLFQGIMPALITPFDAQGRFKTASAEAIMKRELDQGVQGFYVNGATGEGLFLSEQTRRESAECAVETCKGRGKVIVHVGAVDAQQALRLARHAGETLLSDWCAAAFLLLKNGGTLTFCYPAEQLAAAFRALEQNRFAPKRMQLLMGATYARLALIEAKKLGADGVRITTVPQKGKPLPTDRRGTLA